MLPAPSSSTLFPYTTLFRSVASARRLAKVSYEEMLEIAATGGRVLALRSVEFARNHGVRLHVRSSFTWEPGTWVEEEDEADRKSTRLNSSHANISYAVFCLK